MIKNKKIVISGILVVFVILIFVTILYVNNKFNRSNNLINDIYQNVVSEFDGDNDFKYIINYNDFSDPGKEYYIYVNNNYDIIMETTYFTSVFGKEPSEIITKLVYKENVKSELVDYFDYLFKNLDDNIIELSLEDIDDNNFKYLSKIIYYDKNNLKEFSEYDLSKDYDYKLFYSFVNDYEIYKLDNIFKVKSFNSIDKKSSEYFINFSKDGIDNINKTFDELFLDKEIKELHINDNMISVENKKVIDALINNEEIFMNYSFILTDISCDCISNSVYFGSDSYVVRNGIITVNNDIISRGKYNYDINKILNNIDDFKKDSNYMNYKITLYNGKDYIVSHSDLRMIDLLKGLDIKWH